MSSTSPELKVPQPAPCSRRTHAGVLYRLRLPLAHEDSCWFVLQPSEPVSAVSWPLPALLAELRLRGCTRPPGEAAGSADARGNTAAACKQLNLMSGSRCARVCSIETAFFFFFSFCDVILHHQYMVLRLDLKTNIDG